MFLYLCYNTLIFHIMYLQIEYEDLQISKIKSLTENILDNFMAISFIILSDRYTEL